jgi:hypothetical protein
MAYEGKTLVSAKSHMPEQEFFRFHREHIFKH